MHSNAHHNLRVSKSVFRVKISLEQADEINISSSHCISHLKTYLLKTTAN